MNTKELERLAMAMLAPVIREMMQSHPHDGTYLYNGKHVTIYSYNPDGTLTIETGPNETVYGIKPETLPRVRDLEVSLS